MRLIQERIEAARGSSGGVIAFDADGTLWSGDVGEDTFLGAVEAGALRQEALAALQRLALAYDLPRRREANAQALVLFDAYKAGQLPEREVCAMMAWAFAGWSVEALRELVDHLVSCAGFEGRRFDRVAQLVDWSRRLGLRTVIVSASPDFAVAAAAADLGFEPSDIAACAVLISDSVLQPELIGPVPYGEHKVQALELLAPGERLLAAFGDNNFDLPLLKAASVGVAVYPKPALRELLPTAPELLTLGD